MENIRAAFMRRRPARYLLGIIFLMLISAPAFASANVTCQIDDKYIEFELEAIAGRAGPIVQVQVGSIVIKPGAGVSLSSPKITFDRSHIVQQWDLAGDLRLQIETEDDVAKENVNLVIFATLNPKTDKYSGRYVLKISSAGKTKELKGRIKECEAG